MQALDKVGHAITPGCVVAYAAQHGQSSVLRIGHIQSVAAASDMAYHRWSIVVIGLREDRGGVLRLQRPSTLRFPDRMIVLDKTGLPDAVVAAFGLDRLAIELEARFCVNAG